MMPAMTRRKAGDGVTLNVPVLKVQFKVTFYSVTEAAADQGAGGDGAQRQPPCADDPGGRGDGRYSLGGRLGIGPTFELDLEGERREAGEEPAEHGVSPILWMRWWRPSPSLPVAGRVSRQPGPPPQPGIAFGPLRLLRLLRPAVPGLATDGYMFSMSPMDCPTFSAACSISRSPRWA